MLEVVRFVTKHGYSVLFGAVFVHQLGMPVPGPLFLVAAGALAAAGKLGWIAVIVLAVAACVLGDWPWYEAGRQWGDRVLHFIHRLAHDPESHDRRAKKVFNRYGLPILLVSKFVPGLDAVTPPLAGSSGTRRSHFLAFDIVGAGLYSVAYAGIGYLFSDDLDRAAAYIGRVGKVMGALLIIGCFACGFRKVARWYRHTRSCQALPVAEADPK